MREDKTLIVDAGGVGYRVAVLGSFRDKVQIGAEVVLLIHHHTSADAENLYGFIEAEDLKYFELLLTVPSVGPRTAMGILEVAPPKTLSQAVAGEDKTLLTKVSGVGRKTAERILVELKEKIKAPIVSGAAGGVQQEVIEVLMGLGFASKQAREAVSKLPKGVDSVEEAVRAILKSK